MTLGVTVSCHAPLWRLPHDLDTPKPLMPLSGPRAECNANRLWTIGETVLASRRVPEAVAVQPTLNELALKLMDLMWQ